MVLVSFNPKPGGPLPSNPYPENGIIFGGHTLEIWDDALNGLTGLRIPAEIPPTPTSPGVSGGLNISLPRETVRLELRLVPYAQVTAQAFDYNQTPLGAPVVVGPQNTLVHCHVTWPTPEILYVKLTASSNESHVVTVEMA